MVFSGTTNSDYEKLINIPEAKRPEFIDFASSDFLSLRTSILNYIKAVYPNDYNRFVESDLGILIAEMISAMGANINFKTEFLANENILATVQRRENLQRLLELVGVRLRGPISAVGDAKFTLNAAPTWGSPAEAILTPDLRTVSVTSPEDGANVTYTLYKIVNGVLDSINQNGSLVLNESELEVGSTTVFTNLALLEGSLAITSGTFSSEESLKTVDLPRSPVVEGSVEVFIDSENTAASGAYTRVRNLFYASGASDKIFQVDYGDRFQATVVFGDGTYGVSPPNNSTYIISYRVGGGTRGNLLAETINAQKSFSIDSVDSPGILENITAITGGTNSETVEHAKTWAPLTFRRQDRCVTLPDYTAFANAFRGSVGTVAKAVAVTRDSFSSGNVLDIYVLERANDTQLKRATPQFKKELLADYDDVKMVTDELVIVDGLIRTLDLILTIFVDKFNDTREDIIKQEVRVEVNKFFNVDNMDFGKELNLAELNRAVFRNNKVRFSRVDNLDDNIRVDFNEIIQLNNLTINVSYV
jgi:hypothetical protein